MRTRRRRASPSRRRSPCRGHLVLSDKAAEGDRWRRRRPPTSSRRRRCSPGSCKPSACTPHGDKVGTLPRRECRRTSARNRGASYRKLSAPSPRTTATGGTVSSPSPRRCHNKKSPSFRRAATSACKASSTTGKFPLDKPARKPAGASATRRKTSPNDRGRRRTCRSPCRTGCSGNETGACASWPPLATSWRPAASPSSSKPGSWEPPTRHLTVSSAAMCAPRKLCCTSGT
mmetsp:Transcript_53115/g.153252  ORF Transcript_53115/g.153252 Transcript_53115/m.153252 type:complete len:231 (-) Transcript_53115:476-1168(-)